LLAKAFALSDAGRNAEAILLINQLAAQNDTGALFTLAEMKWRGGMVPQDLAQARDLYRRAGEAGHAAGAALFTNLLASGTAGARNWPLALKHLRAEARSDPARRAMLDLLGKMALTDEGAPDALPAARKLSDAPKVSHVAGLFSAPECAWLRALAEAGFGPSYVNDAQGRQVLDPIRQSDGSTLHWLIENPALHALNQRIAAISGTVADQGEALQILRYRPGQQYRPHLDQVRVVPNPRAVTVLVWLNQDYEGGETRFTQTGLSVKGRTGDALVFCNTDADGKPDALAEHAGEPVIKGTKYLASRWIHAARWLP
jgi:prolyl 4-hydroxylase